jgi:hypothetical protein
MKSREVLPDDTEATFCEIRIMSLRERPHNNQRQRRNCILLEMLQGLGIPKVQLEKR